MTSIVISSASVLVALISAFVSYRSSRIARRGLVANHLIASLSDMIVALQEVSSAGFKLNTEELVRQSREYIDPHFNAFKSADSRVSLLLSSVRSTDDDGLRTVANNLAVNIRQADEWWDLTFDLDDDTLAGYSKEEAATLRASRSFQSVVTLAADLGNSREIVSLQKWWATKILRSAKDSYVSVYSVRASYMTQHTRLLDDFVREYLEPWAEKVVRDGLR